MQHYFFVFSYATTNQSNFHISGFVHLLCTSWSDAFFISFYDSILSLQVHAVFSSQQEMDLILVIVLCCKKWYVYIRFYSNTPYKTTLIVFAHWWEFKSS